MNLNSWIGKQTVFEGRKFVISGIQHNRIRVVEDYFPDESTIIDWKRKTPKGESPFIPGLLLSRGDSIRLFNHVQQEIK
jgi:hypothetical protein